MILDFHTHIGQGHRSAAHVIAHHNTYGGGKSVVLPIEPGDCTAMGTYAGMRTELAIEAVEEYGDELIPFCHVNPLAPDALGPASPLPRHRQVLRLWRAQGPAGL